MRIRGEAFPQEDLTNQAGWMYADLFLALMVIFLATISFVPVFSNNQTNKESSITNYSKIFDKTLNMIIDSYDAGEIQKRVTDFLTQSNYSLKSRVVFIQIVGGYDPKSEGSQTGIQRAVNFSKLLDRGNPSITQDSAISLSVSRNIKTSQIVLRLSFASTIGVTK